MSWSKRFAEPIVLPDGGKLRTLHEAVAHLGKSGSGFIGTRYLSLARIAASSSNRVIQTKCVPMSVLFSGGMRGTTIDAVLLDAVSEKIDGDGVAAARPTD